MKTQDDGIHLSRKSALIVIFVLLSINILFLMMGVLIGRGDLKWSKEPTDDVAEIKTEAPVAVTSSLEDELSVFSEEVEDRRRDPIDPSYLDEGGSTTTPPPQTQAAKQPKSDPVAAKPPPKKVEPEPAKTTPKPRKGTAPAPIAAPATLFWVQVSASGDSSKSQAMKAKITGMGYKAIVVKEGGYHKVRVGPYAARASATRDLKKLNSTLGTKGWIVTK